MEFDDVISTVSVVKYVACIHKQHCTSACTATTWSENVQLETFLWTVI